MDTMTLLVNAWPAAAREIFLHDLLRYLIGAGGVYLLVNVSLRTLLARRKIRDDAPPGRQLVREFVVSMRTVLIFFVIGMTIWAGSQFGWFHVYDDPARYGWAYFWASVIAMILLHDAWFYWTHRLIHHRRLFRRSHRTHHLSHNPSPFTSYSFDVAEAVLNAIYLPLVLTVLPAAHLAIIVWAAHMMLRNAIGHSGYELLPAGRDGRPAIDWLTTVTHHDLHHSEARWNYGLYFTWWDRWMGTEHPRYHERFAAAIRASLQSGPGAPPAPRTRAATSSGALPARPGRQ
ncbi:MAG: sterol desaturase family protein [Woeseiaceae bacterium]|nr:sterol desaturase family protein [Woeseiaceae bacterium]